MLGASAIFDDRSRSAAYFARLGFLVGTEEQIKVRIGTCKRTCFGSLVSKA
jgi:hypothetical protein